MSKLNKTANKNDLDLKILKNTAGHTILDVELLEDEMGKLKERQSHSWKCLFIFSLTIKGDFKESIVDANEKLDGMDAINKTIGNNLMKMETLNQTVEENSLGLKVLNSTMGKCRKCSKIISTFNA